jgi:D-alanyl-lipoteichoic acid acyltransferase DltB (MBOAT superfamily)
MATGPVVSSVGILGADVPSSHAATVHRADPCEANATISITRYGLILGQLALILWVFREFRLEERAFLRLGALVFAGFAVQYWLPYRWRERFCIALSLGGAFVLLEPGPATLLLSVGAVFYAVLASPFSYRTRLALVLGIAAALAYGRAAGGLGLPYQFWPVVGALFMFRMVVYLYELRHSKTGASLKEYLSYFFMLPNYYFLLFPVVDFQTLRKSYYRRDIHDVAQQGVHWIVRGAVQLLLYRLIYHLKGPSHAPEAITSFGALALAMVTTYLLYLRVSAQFHIVIGMLHLFGYDLPETHRRYLLAHSLTDFWRRINIYWKDFMVKLVYFPAYFRFRKQGEVRAQVIATALVFIATWLLHSYQWFWLRGDILLTWPDTLFWAILGALVIVNVLVEARRKGRRPVSDSWGERFRHGLAVAGTFSLITTLWYLWNAPSLSEWWELVTWWQIG